MNCPQCGSTEWKLATLVHAEGLSTATSQTRGTGVGLGVGSGGLSVGVGSGGSSTSGIQQTELSRRAAQYITPNSGTSWIPGILTLASLGFVVMAIFISGWWLIAAALSFAASIPGHSADIDEWTRLNQIYSKTRMCLRCGKFYLPPEQSAALDDQPSQPERQS